MNMHQRSLSEPSPANAYHVLAGQFENRAGDPLFTFEDRTAIDFAEFECRSKQVAALLLERGVKPGDRVAVQAPKSVEQIMLYVAVLQVGATFLPLNPAYGSEETNRILLDAEPRIFVQDDVSFVAKAAAYRPLDEVEPRDPDSVAVLLYTSGTTGLPKGAMLSHRNLATNARALVAAWRLTSDDVLLHALPIFHAHGLLIAMNCALLAGCSVVWMSKFDEAKAVKLLTRSTVFMGVPTLYTRLLGVTECNRDAVANVRVFICGSAPLLRSTFEAFEARTGHQILERYGMSEALVIASNPYDGRREPGSVGFPLPGVQMRIGAAGVLEISGPSVFKGYWRQPETTAGEFTPDGFFVTGDVARQDADGRYWLVGRSKDLIISGGFNVYPSEVERALEEVAGVRETAVIGVPHPDFGEAVVAVICGPASEHVLEETAKARLANFKRPKRFVYLETLPRNAMGKVQKSVLRTQFASIFPTDPSDA